MKNVQSYKGSSMNWRIVSKPTDVAELSQTDHQNIYLVYVQDDIGNNIEAKVAYGIDHRTEVTKEFIYKYQAYGIVKIEHQE